MYEVQGKLECKYVLRHKLYRFNPAEKALAVEGQWIAFAKHLILEASLINCEVFIVKYFYLSWFSFVHKIIY